ncbi:hypothetical protein FRC02_000937 [Tulasnella sp. 418]|nr:hypothetical protein FRC02_000937 [Tulasnella sp. 418]
MVFDTPKAKRTMTRQYSPKEKEAILANLDLEVDARRRKFETRLAEDLADFHARHKLLLANIPRVLLTMTVEEFGAKYDGSITKYMEEVTKARLAEGGMVDIVASARKRKHQSASDHESGPFKAPKSARKLGPQPSPTKSAAPFASPSATPTASRRFFIKNNATPKASQLISRPRHPTTSQSTISYGSSQPVTSSNLSPKKVINTGTRLPSASSFNPSLPSKAPSYPPEPRALRDTDTLMSVNGSPVANPWASRFGSASSALSFSDLLPPNQQTKQLATTSNPVVPQLKRTKSNNLFAVRTRSGALIELDPNLSPSREVDDVFAGLTDSAKKEVQADVVRLAERYGLLKF